MIKIKFTKDKIFSAVRVVNMVIEIILERRSIPELKDRRAEMATHLYELRDLLKKLSMKFIQAQCQDGSRGVLVSISPTQGYILQLYRSLLPADPETGYDLVILEEISKPVFQKLLT